MEIRLNMDAGVTRICLWSGPRNISTAMMYSFAQREDTTVFDEPLYAHYLSNSPAISYHPGAYKVLASMENDSNKVIEAMIGDHKTPVVFFKQMAHHLVTLDWSFMQKFVNIILTRDPRDMILSYVEQIETPCPYDLGYGTQIEILNYLMAIGQKPMVLDAKQVLLNPEKVLTQLCNAIQIPFDRSMLSWKAGPRAEDGIWAKYWYHTVHQSTGFMPYRRKKTIVPRRLIPLLEESIPLYEKLSEHAIAA